MAGRTNHRGFGAIKRLKSGRYHASYVGPDCTRHNAPATYLAKQDAEGWLADEQRAIGGGTWVSPRSRRLAKASKGITFGPYADAWLADRTLKPRTRDHYRSLLANQLAPAFSDVPLTAITPQMVRAWHTSMGTKTPTLRSHAYGLLRTVLGEAVHDQIIPSNPCHIRGAGNSKRVHKIKPATLPELEQIAAAMPEKYRLLVLLAAWCGLRFGELTELRRPDIDLKHGVIRVSRGVTRVGSEFIVGTPKSDAGTRTVAIPPHLLPAIKQHLHDNITGGKDGLLFPAADGATHLAPSTLYKVFYPARAKAGRADLRFHDLRHTGGVLAAATGATLAELMARLGHSTAGAALLYQHASRDRDGEIAKALSALVETPSAL